LYFKRIYFWEIEIIEKSIDHINSKLNGQLSPSHYEYPEEKNQNYLRDLGLSSKQFHVLFNNSLLAVLLCKVIFKKQTAVDMVAIEINQAYERIFNINRQQILNKKFSQFHHVCRKDWLAFYGQIALKGNPETREVYFNERSKWFQTYAYSPKREYLLVMFNEITQRKKTEHQLLMSEKKYRRLYETTQDGIMARDLDGRMIECNRAYAKMLGYSKKELRALSVRDLMPKKWHRQRDVIVKKVLTTGKSIVFEREYKRKDGTVFPSSVRTWRVTNGKGKPIGIWSIVRDISQQKQLQEYLQKQAELLEQIVQDRTKQLYDSERLAAIGQTAAMVGHDLRNPLQTIIGELYLAKTEVDSLSESELKSNMQESIRSIEEQVIYMDKIVSDLQAFVKPVKIDKNLVDIKKLVEDVLESVIIPQNISVEVNYEGDFPQVKADLQLLKRVLINLVTNAIQAMPNEGKITIKAKMSNPEQACIIVEDQGVGIPEKIKHKIFTPLFTTKPRGQGFGLAVCKRVIEAHGGTINFESQEGKGTKFEIQIPIN
jgi:PAS domain S-box-containing protein